MKSIIYTPITCSHSLADFNFFCFNFTSHFVFENFKTNWLLLNLAVHTRAKMKTQPVHQSRGLLEIFCHSGVIYKFNQFSVSETESLILLKLKKSLFFLTLLNNLASVLTVILNTMECASSKYSEKLLSLKFR